METVLERFQENKLRGLRELLGLFRSREAAVEQGGGGEDELATIADLLIDEAIGVKQSLQRQWEYHWTMGLAGRHHDMAAQQIRLSRLLEDGGRTMVEVAALARRMVNLSGRDVARLTEFERQAGSFAPWVDECRARWEALGRAHRPLDRERVARAREAFKRGEGEEPAAVIARLERGGPLVQE